jgi:hypothetical protein
MLLDNDLPRLRFESGAQLAAPRAVLESPSHPGRLLNRRDVLPSLVVARTIAPVQGIEDPQLRLAGGV